MTVQELSDKLKLRALSMPEPERDVLTGYAGDLLSWVMGRAPEDAAWFTIMSNVNIIAVAMLRDVAAIIVCEGAEIGIDVIERAKEQNINLFVSDRGIYELCAATAALI